MLQDKKVNLPESCLFVKNKILSDLDLGSLLLYSDQYTKNHIQSIHKYYEIKKLMNNNDVLRRIRYIFDYNDAKMISIFALAENKATRTQISDWLKKETDNAFKECSDTRLAFFLNGLIIDKRGKTPWPQPEIEKHLTNNKIFTKLKIALNLKAEDVLNILSLAGFKISKHELSAFFRRPNHRQYRECKDQILRNFLKGLQIKHRP